MGIKVSRILHAGYVLECDGTRIAFDTIFENPFSKNCYAFPAIRFDEEQIRQLQFDAVFISHFHDDHCSLESLNLLSRETPIYIYCIFEELLEWIRQLGFKNVHSLVLNESVHVGSFEVIPRRALDVDVDSLFQIKAADLQILNVVDSWIDEETLKLLKNQNSWDMILWPFQTMRELEVITPSQSKPAPWGLPEEWIEQLTALNPKFVVPSSCQFQQESWSWYNHAFFPISYSRFQKEVESFLPQTKVVRLNPSVSVFLEKDQINSAEPLPWIIPEGLQEVDYDYRRDLVPPSTAEVAKHFPEISSEQRAHLDDYCQKGLIKRFKEVESDLDIYFEEPRWWQLGLYDHQGELTRYFYWIKGRNIVLKEDLGGPLAWTTEVPMAKVIGALESGETLTSMYMRINDQKFQSEIESEIREVDIAEDPLVRCLFRGVFGAYQLNQLRRIRSRQA